MGQQVGRRSFIEYSPNLRMKTSEKPATATGKVPDESLQRFNLLARATNEGIWDFHLEKGETYYNKDITRLFGYSKEEMRDNVNWWRDNLHPSDKKRVIERLDQLLRSKENSWWGEYRFRCKSGHYKKVLEKLYVVRDEKGKPYRIVGTMQDLTRIRKIEKAGEEEARRQHRAFSLAVLQAEEQERKDISDELNENINQVLATINLNIEQVKQEAASKEQKEWLQNAQQLLRLSIEKIRSISKQLSPESLPFFGLLPALEELLQAAGERSKIRFELNAAKTVEKKISKEKKLLFYRIVQLQLKNIRVHSKATHAMVQLQLVGEQVKLSVKDNGNGFDPARLEFGHGFSRIQQLSDAYEGSFNVKGNPGKGCVLEIIV